MAVESIRGAVEAAIQRASTATGVDFGFLLGAFRYLDNKATLHLDAAAMPKRRAAWSSWNYLASGKGSDRRLCVT